MRILAVSDAHGVMSAVKELVSELTPDLLLSCGDWGDSGRVSREDFEWLVERVHTLSIFGNHDDINLLSTLQNVDGSPLLLANGEVRDFRGVTLTGISGIWAKSHRLPWYITDEDVSGIADQADRADILLTHGCAIGLADSFPTGRHGGQMCFLRAYKRIKPRLYLCGHLHAQQLRKMSDGSFAINIGSSNNGQYAQIEFQDGELNAEIGEKASLASVD